MASTDKYFVIGIGGTGMRCLEAFTHMCAMGMFDSKEIDILTLDTDFTNGNKQRTETLIDTYNDIKRNPDGSDGNANNNSFFSAKLNKTEFVSNYSPKGKRSFEELTNLKSEGTLSDNKLLADLFLGEAVQGFNLEHGYRAQTHMGSYLMYHSFIEVAKKLSKGENLNDMENKFGKFLLNIHKAGAHAKIFVLGSIFGGTGASSIPVLPKALNDALKIYDSSFELHPEAKFGATLLTEYFEFKKPDESQKKEKKDGVIADSSFFTLNSQAALQFYESDPTVKRTYKKMYHIGWPIKVVDFSKDKKDTKTDTGGPTQKNPCHITEFLCACAAWDFFNSDSELDVKEASYLYKSVHENDGQLDFSFNDFIGKENGLFFARKFGGFIALMHLVLSKNKGADGDDGVKGLLGRISEATQSYTGLDSQFTQKLNGYFKSFGYTIESEKFLPGWLYQIKSTVSGNLIMDDGAFTRNIKELRKLEPGNLFPSKFEYDWPTSSILSSDTFSPFIKLLKDEETNPEPSQNVSTSSEKFIAHLYNAIKLSPKTQI
jgi:hypothetical protein